MNGSPHRMNWISVMDLMLRSGYRFNSGSTGFRTIAADSRMKNKFHSAQGLAQAKYKSQPRPKRHKQIHQTRKITPGQAQQEVQKRKNLDTSGYPEQLTT